MFCISSHESLNILNKIYRNIVRTFVAILKIRNYSNCNQLLIFLLKTNDNERQATMYLGIRRRHLATILNTKNTL